ncbi:RdgB/HAM1 family non-canonical purine NTP pyrophosphatase [Gulosibacter molinativorax]|uniref:dITP/XTP pyrophosphatase n=1 Tax=Gulosibacter molinativorax TaxID=256821 RepID=A0ABT7CBC1_9MICO|nr:RdgB/HAM1 family non-canonical purine NTP pyrophosphatase [Gulosibacter molinativorax]MDJ1372489.1 non-canonical purine NTP pyrophosphatase, RdgB/HAM1 family [Gulosibacter molinativorax]QUY61934.1 Non-canonical purine NTP pyrophosphatase [Gulosibacter molinativorax]
MNSADGVAPATRVVLATKNEHKIDELRRILTPALPTLELVGYDGPSPVESGLSFQENALIKARAAAAHTGLPAIADDSGIAVDILGGMPGIFSARWSGPDRSDEDNWQLLLWQLNDVPDFARTAQFVASAAIVVPGRFADSVLGKWHGSILRSARGDGGFGYDPVFSPDGSTRSAAEMLPEQKDAVSHRRRAFDALIPVLKSSLGL